MKGAKPSIKERALGHGKQWIPGASFAPARVPWVQLISSLNQLQEVAVWRVWSSLLKNFSETKIQSPKSCRMRVSRHCDVLPDPRGALSHCGKWGLRDAHAHTLLSSLTQTWTQKSESRSLGCIVLSLGWNRCRWHAKQSKQSRQCFFELHW